ncbi:C39 family peptidase [Mycolicibacterium vaccae]|uniref:Peptidase C39-like domain-containing protein n=1 Tax=Mycolicibacterium vaccae ATCC 25954 TaxID=1194972 RepID=K0UWF2_MYCVA|nr:C39 family peptidase [Mycolicibacterium vaccae]ANI41780.1 hypothetical protein MYVA_4707 [Mycolicibacterium vaccae 95051]EJZ06923.1 hypothetical protein MVAC_20343 [Mycolicibacterium vaccae ATCC 25954]MCV7059553.1 C39 family peptidase [Mycolicibacterium vaccae]
MESSKLVAPLGAGILALGVGLLAVGGSGVAAASPDGSSSSSASDGSDSRDRDSAASRDRGSAGSGSRDRASSERERERASSSTSAREPATGSGRHESAKPSGKGDPPSGKGDDNDDRTGGESASAGDADENVQSSDGRPSVRPRSTGVEPGTDATPLDAGAAVVASTEEPPTPEAVAAAPVADGGVAPAPESAPTLRPRTLVPATAAPAEWDRRALVRTRVTEGERISVPLAMPSRPTSPSAPSSPMSSGTLLGALGLLRRDLENRNLEDVALSDIYGDPDRLSQYWARQSSDNCLLMATAMVIGQITGKMPTELQIVWEAMRTQSQYPVNGEYPLLYKGLRTSKWSKNGDMMKMLAQHGISSVWGNSTTEDEALEALKDALSTPGTGIIAAVFSPSIYQSIFTGTVVKPPTGQGSNHGITIIGYDAAKDVVIVNDSAAEWVLPGATGPLGQRMEVPREVFMAAWKAGSFARIVTTGYTGRPADRPAWLNLTPRRLASSLNLAVAEPVIDDAGYEHRLASRERGR